MAEEKPWSGYCAAFGMALAYGIVAFCVVFGLKGIAHFLELHEVVFQLIAGAALLVCGWRGLRGATDKPIADRKSAGAYVGDFVGTFAMTLVNPLPFASFAVMVTSLGLLKGMKLDIQTDIQFGMAVCAGAALFWILLRQVFVWMRRRWQLQIGTLMRKGSAFALLCFGGGMLLAALIP